MGASTSVESVDPEVQRNRVLAGMNKEKLAKRHEEGIRNRQEEEGLVYTKYSDSVVYTVLSGTLEALVKALYDPRFQDELFLSEFVLNYTVFTDPGELVQMFADNYYSASESEALNILQVFIQWMEIDREIYADPFATNHVLAFVDDAMANTENAALEDHLYNLAETVVRRSRTEGGEKKIKPDWRTNTCAVNMVNMGVFAVAFSLTNMAVEREKSKRANALFEVATPRQLAVEMTLVCHDLFAAVQPIECLHGAFNKYPDRTPNMTAWTHYNERIKCLVVTSIVSQEEVDARASMFSRWVLTAWECLKLNNFNDAMSLWMTLAACYSLTRLKRTLDAVKPAVHEVIAKLATVLDPSARVEGREDLRGSFVAYHFFLSEATPPCIPSQYVVADNLFKVNDKTEDHLPNRHIDFVKLREMGAIIYGMIEFQKTKYFLASEGDLRDFLLHSPVIVEEKSWEALSKKNEPPINKRKSIFGR